MAGMHIDIIAVGKLKERYWVQACEEYRKRLRRYIRLQVLEVADLSARSDHDIEAVLNGEANSIKRKLSATSYSVALDQQGKQLSSEQLAHWLAELQNQGMSQMSFIVGGSWGLSASLKNKVDALLSLGKMTLPHNLARVVLLEQIYRAFRIINAEPYHK